MPSPIRFAEVKRMLEGYGWSEVRITGSHHIFGKPGESFRFSIPVHKGLVKHGYLRDIKRKLGLP